MKYKQHPLQSAGAILLFALAYFFDNRGIITALIPAVTAHELGHLSVLKAFGAQIDGLHIAPVGLKMNYRGSLSQKGRVLSLVAGPAAGGAYAMLCFCSVSPFWCLSGALSAALTAFNLLPALPLDGGQLLLELCGARSARHCSLVVAAALILIGFLLLPKGTFSVLGMGLWLLLYHGFVH